MPVLSDDDLRAYHRDGFVRLAEAFPRDLARHCRDLMWAQLPEDPDDPSTWTRPVAHIFSQTDPAFVEAATSPRWVEAIVQVAGPDAEATPWMGGTFAVLSRSRTILVTTAATSTAAIPARAATGSTPAHVTERC